MVRGEGRPMERSDTGDGELAMNSKPEAAVTGATAGSTLDGALCSAPAMVRGAMAAVIVSGCVSVGSGCVGVESMAKS